MARYTTYWRWIPIRMIQSYRIIKNERTMQAIVFTEAIKRAIAETELLPDGKLRIRAVEMIYMKRTHTTDGAAYKLNASRRTVQRWLTDFVDLVALYAGYVGECQLKDGAQSTKCADIIPRKEND